MIATIVLMVLISNLILNNNFLLQDMLGNILGNYIFRVRVGHAWRMELNYICIVSAQLNFVISENAYIFTYNTTYKRHVKSQWNRPYIYQLVRVPDGCTFISFVFKYVVLSCGLAALYVITINKI